MLPAATRHARITPGPAPDHLAALARSVVVRAAARPSWHPPDQTALNFIRSLRRPSGEGLSPLLQSLAPRGTREVGPKLCRHLLGGCGLPVAAGQRPSGHSRLARHRVHGHQHSPDRGGVRQIATHAQGRSMDRRPITDRGERAGTGQHRADRDQQNRLQAVTTPTAPARIRNLHQLAQQSDRLPGGQALGGQPGLADSSHEWGRGR
jgi:hypothetical protein